MTLMAGKTQTTGWQEREKCPTCSRRDVENCVAADCAFSGAPAKTTLTEAEKAMMYERMSGERLSDEDRAHVMAGGKFIPPHMRQKANSQAADHNPTPQTTNLSHDAFLLVRDLTKVRAGMEVLRGTGRDDIQAVHMMLAAIEVEIMKELRIV